MIKLLAVVVGIAALVIVAGAWLIGQEPAAAGGVVMTLSSDPFPMAVGRSTLLLSLTRADGTPVEDAVVQIESNMDHRGMLPATGRVSGGANGQYAVPVIWPMMGLWQIDVTARLPGQAEAFAEQFEVVVYAIAADNGGPLTTYRSVGESAALVSDPAREMLIVIPQGAQVMIASGLIDDIVPSEIRLQVSGQNTLIIQNNDLVDHTVGPFVVRSGETIRQEFTRPAFYQGVCTVRFNTVVNIVVEE